MSEQHTLPQEEITEQQLSELLQIRRDKLAALCEAGQNPYEITKFEFNTYPAHARAEYERREAAYLSENGQPEEGKTIELEPKIEVAIAGRMMTRRIMGKASFLDLQDSEGRIQVYVSRSDVGEDTYAAFKKWDIG
ncbi:MAG: lysine--tRNA ligase, partial [Clostridia bacterium]|nr:lysine--tRNA ligase [Clostridia bacterium]